MYEGQDINVATTALTSKITDVLDRQCPITKITVHEYMFGEQCKKRSTSASYTDDANYTVAGRKCDNLLPRVSKVIKDNGMFCNGNHLKLNEEKPPC